MSLKKIRTLEKQMVKLKNDLAKEVKKLKPEPIQDYVVLLNGKKKHLSDLFGKHESMILVHNMGSDCPYCSLWADGFNGLRKHLESHAAFVVENDDSPQSIKAQAKKRGWKFTMVSSQGSSLKTDLGMREGDDYSPGISILQKPKKGPLTRTMFTYLGKGDNYCNLWDLFALLPQGSGSFSPK